MNQQPDNRNINKDMSRYPLGQAERLDDSKVRLTFVREYAYPVARVWQALTDPAETEKWWAQTRGSLRAGSSFDLKWLNGKDEGHGAELEWWNGKVLACEPPTLLEISNAMHGSIRMELSGAAVGDVQDGTRLLFTNVVSAPDEMALMSLAGWHSHLDHLQEALEGKAIDWPRWWEDLYPSWERIHADYAAAISMPASPDAADAPDAAPGHAADAAGGVPGAPDAAADAAGSAASPDTAAGPGAVAG